MQSLFPKSFLRFRAEGVIQSVSAIIRIMGGDASVCPGSQQRSRRPFSPESPPSSRNAASRQPTTASPPRFARASCSCSHGPWPRWPGHFRPSARYRGGPGCSLCCQVLPPAAHSSWSRRSSKNTASRTAHGLPGPSEPLCSPQRIRFGVHRARHRCHDMVDVRHGHYFKSASFSSTFLNLG